MNLNILYIIYEHYVNIYYTHLNIIYILFYMYIVHRISSKSYI